MGGIILLIIAFVIYFLPSIWAVKAEHSKSSSIIILNLFLGWTFIGWVVALVWAASEDNK